MSTWIWVVVAAAAAVVVCAVAALVVSRRRHARSERLRDQFGLEYARAAGESPSRRDAERELAEREERHARLEIRPLSPEAHERYADRWRAVQARFVDDPQGAVREADRLVRQIMTERGYPDDGFDRRAADISVEHPELAASYRSAHEMLDRRGDGTATTEELRYTMVDYRALFDEFMTEEAVATR